MLLTKIRAKMIGDAYSKELQPGMRVLDFGCGNGIVSKYIQDRFKVEIIGTDILEYHENRISFEPLIDGKLLLEDNSFDAVLFNDALHHANNQEVLLKEAFRLAPKILAFETEPNFAIKVFDKMINRFYHKDMATPLTFRTAAEWTELLSPISSGHEVIKLKKPFPGYPFNHLYIRATR